jgi:adenylate cyclase
MPFLQVTTNDGRIYTSQLSRNETTIGRGTENDIVLNDHTVSRNHAKIVRTKKGYILTDLGSFNGTRLNEKAIQAALLANQDLIKIGLVQIVFLSAEKAPSLKPDTVVLSNETEFESGRERIIKSSPEAYQVDSRDLLVSAEPRKGSARTGHQLKEALSSLERSNKVLYILYEVSRQLNSIHDFNELLKKIMDLIFIVIDADYGFLILIGDGGKDNLVPVVVKSRDGFAQHDINLKASRTIINRVIHDKVALLTSNAMDDSRLGYAKSLFVQQIRSAICVPLWRKDRMMGVIQLESVSMDNQFTQDDLELLKAIGSQMAMVIEQASLNEQIRQEERMRSRLERFHSPQIIDLILKGDQEAKDDFMEPKYITATILFTDINGFTRLSEQLPPRDVNIILNQYFSRMTDIIFKYDGTLDKYIGDGLMAVFGAPMGKEDDAERAIRAAKEMIKELKALMKETKDEKRFTIRIGINTGRVVAGNIGSPKRLDYTVIGDAVNMASRLESIAQPNQVLIGEETYRLVKDKFDITAAGRHKVKGKRAEIMAYEVL